MINLEKFLSSEEKAEVVKSLLEGKGAKVGSVVFNKRYGWDFKVSQGGKVVFSVELGEERFEWVVRECVRALHDIRVSNADAIGKRKPR